MCILFLYHTLGEQTRSDHDGPRLASMDFSEAAGKSAAAYARGKGSYKLIVASNRDEDLDRPSTPIHFWKDTKSNVLAGRDMVGGGTWLGVSRSGRFATVTNIPSAWDDVLAVGTQKRVHASQAVAVATAAVATAATLLRDHHGSSSSSGWVGAVLSASFRLLPFSASVPSPGLLYTLWAAAGLATAASVGLSCVAFAAKGLISRGGLVADFLKGEEDAQTYCSRLSKERHRYAGFNLLLADPSGAWVLSNRDQAGVTHLPHGLYGVSNGTLDESWPKMVHGKSRVLEVLLRTAADPSLTEDSLVDLLMDVLADESECSTQVHPSHQYLDIPEEWEKSLSRVCVPPTPVPELLIWFPRINYLGTAAKSLWVKITGATSLATRRRQMYGTRSSTVVLVDAAGRIKVVERNLVGSGSDGGIDGGNETGRDGTGTENGKKDQGAVKANALPRSMRYCERKTVEFCDV